MQTLKTKWYYLLTPIISIFFIFWIVYAPSIFLKISKDFEYSASISSADNFFDEETREFKGEQFSITTFSYEAIKSTQEGLVIENQIDVRTPEGEKIFSTQREYGIDPNTGQHIDSLGDREREGYLFAPRNLKPGESFTYWHVNYNAPAIMTFVGKERINGLLVYNYKTNYSDVIIDQTKDLAYLPKVSEEIGIVVEPTLNLWIEPASGYMVKYSDYATAYYYNIKTGNKIEPWNRFTNTYTNESIQEHTAIAKKERNKTLLVTVFAPLIIIIAAILSLIYTVYRTQRYSKYLTVRNNVKLLLIFIYSTALVLWFGWIFDIQSLMRIHQIMAGVNPMCVLSFIFIPLILLFQIENSGKKYNGFIIVLSIFIILVGLLKILSEIEVINFHIDQILFKDEVLRNIPQSKMPVIAAIGLFILGSTFLLQLSEKAKKLNFPKLLATALLTMSGALLVIYFAKESPRIYFSEFFVVPINTIFLFWLIAIVLYIQIDILGSSKKEWRYNIPLTLYISLVIFSFVIWGMINRSLREDLYDEFNSDSLAIVDAIQERMIIYDNSLNGAVGYVNASQNISREGWKDYVDSINITENYPGLQGIGYAPVILPEDKEDFERQVREEGFPEFKITPEGERDIYTSIVFLEPFDLRNRRAFGFDMFSEQVRRQAMVRARDNGTSALTGKVTLLQETTEDIQPGFLLYQPVYKPGYPLVTQEDRREALLGYVYSPFRAKDLLSSINYKTYDSVEFKIYDGIEVNPENEYFYKEYEDHDSNSSNTPLFNQIETLYIAGRPWTISFSSLTSLESEIGDRIIYDGVLVAGIVLSTLLYLFLVSVTTGKQKAVRYAQELTLDLRKANNKLAKEKDKIEIEKNKMDTILLSIGDGLFVTNLEGQITLVNETFTRILGYTKNEVEGKRVSEILSMYDEQGMQVPEENRLLTKALRLQIPIISNNDYYYKSKTGRLIPVEITLSPITLDGRFLGVIEVFRDITSEKMYISEIQKFKLAVEGASDQIVITDTEGIVLYSNKAVERITGYKPSEVIGQKAGKIWGSLMSKEYYKEMWETIKNKKQRFESEIKNKRKDGSEYYAEIHISPVLDDNFNIQFFVAIERDITKEKAIDRAKTEFVSLASHQLRTPLSAIGWYTEALLDEDAGKLTHYQRDSLEEILAANRRMVTLVNSLLNVSRIDMGTFAIDPVPSDLIKLAEVAIHEQMPMVKEKKQILNFEHDDLPLIKLDPNLTTIILQNLISNSIKYSPEGAEINISIRKQKENIEIKVKDNGYGIPLMQQSRIFEKLFRADNVLGRESEGTGLGLYVVKSIVDSANGHINFTSEEDKGTEFTILIPLSGMKEKKGTRGLT